MHIIAGQHTPIIAGQSQWSKIGAPMQQIDIVRKKYPYTGQAHGQKDEKIKIQQQRGNPKSPAWHEKERKKPFPGSAALGGIVSSAFSRPSCISPPDDAKHNRADNACEALRTFIPPSFLKKEIRRHIQVLPRNFRKYETTADFRTEAPYTYSFTMICSPSSATW